MSETPAPAAGRSLLFALAGAVAVLALDAFLLGVGVGGLRPLLGHARALALLGVWGVGYGALAVLRPVRTRDPVETRGDRRFVVLALFLVPLVTPMISAWCERLGLAPLPGGPALRWGGVALAAAGFLLRILAMERLGARFSPLIEVQRAHALETGGAYRFMRHPGYAGSWLANLGAILAFGSAWPLVLALAMGAATAARVRREEVALEAAFGAAWSAYRARTGAFGPRLGR